MATFALLAAAAVCANAQIATVPWPTPSKSPLNLTMGYGTVNSTGTRFNWYISILDDLSRFSIQLPTQGCAVRETTTSTANLHSCIVAANAGFFQFSANPTFCLGEIVVGGKIVEWANDGSPLFAVTSDKTTVIGPLTKADIASMNVTYATSGFAVIVLNGRVNTAGVEQAKAAIKELRPNAEEVAPRTVMAVDAAGRLLLVAIDGVEAKLLGVTMTEIAEIMSGGAAGFPFVAAHAVNMDGGGSTTMSAAPGLAGAAQIYNRPTSTDIGDIVERQVTNIACITA